MHPPARDTLLWGLRGGSSMAGPAQLTSRSSRHCHCTSVFRNGAAPVTTVLISIHLGPSWVPSSQQSRCYLRHAVRHTADNLKGAQRPEVTPPATSAPPPDTSTLVSIPGQKPHLPNPVVPLALGSGKDRASSDPAPALLPV